MAWDYSLVMPAMQCNREKPFFDNRASTISIKFVKYHPYYQVISLRKIQVFLALEGSWCYGLRYRLSTWVGR